jgi:hypothetical protein
MARKRKEQAREHAQRARELEQRAREREQRAREREVKALALKEEAERRAAEPSDPVIARARASEVETYARAIRTHHEAAEAQARHAVVHRPPER